MVNIMKYIVSLVFVATIIGGGLFFYTNNYKKSTPSEKALPQTTNTAGTTEKPVEAATGTAPTTQEAVTANTKPVATVPATTDTSRVTAVTELQTFLTDWKNSYKTDCAGKEATTECTLWKAGIEKIEATCFQNKLTGAEVTKCGKDVFGATFQAALQAKGSGTTTSTTKSTVDSHGIDLATLPEGQTVKVFKNGPTEEVSYGNEITVTYVRTGDTVKITETIVYDGNNGRSQYTRTVSLK